MSASEKLLNRRNELRVLLATGTALIAASCTSIPPLEKDASSVAGQDIAGALALYSKGWAARDTDAILALHADDTQFHLVSWGSEPAQGKAEVREAFDEILASNPNYESTVRSIRLGKDFAVVEYNIAVDPDRPVRVGTSQFTPPGTRYQAPAIDIIVFQDGLVTEKVTYLDTETIRANSISVESIE